MSGCDNGCLVFQREKGMWPQPDKKSPVSASLGCLYLARRSLPNRPRGSYTWRSRTGRTGAQAADMSVCAMNVKRTPGVLEASSNGLVAWSRREGIDDGVGLTRKCQTLVVTKMN